MSKKVNPKKKKFVESKITAEERKILNDPKGWITGPNSGKPMVNTGKVARQKNKKVKPKKKAPIKENVPEEIFNPNTGVQ